MPFYGVDGLDLLRRGATIVLAAAIVIPAPAVHFIADVQLFHAEKPAVSVYQTKKLGTQKK